MRKMNTSECPALDVTKLARAGGLLVGARTLLLLSSGDAIRVTAVNETELQLLYQIDYVEHRYTLGIEVRHLCGNRTYRRLICPGCGASGRLLYLRGRFACRLCQNLNTRASQRAATEQVEDRVRQLRERLQAGSAQIDDITKPGGMRTTDFNRQMAILRTLEPVAVEGVKRYVKRSGLGALMAHVPELAIVGVGV